MPNSQLCLSGADIGLFQRATERAARGIRSLSEDESYERILDHLQGCRACRRVVERATVSNVIAAEMLGDDTDCAMDNWREAVIAVLDVSLAREVAARANTGAPSTNGTKEVACQRKQIS